MERREASSVHSTKGQSRITTVGDRAAHGRPEIVLFQVITVCFPGSDHPEVSNPVLTSSYKQVLYFHLSKISPRWIPRPESLPHPMMISKLSFHRSSVVIY
jgi:hypothetical protein